MKHDQGYFAQAESWAIDQQQQEARARRTAWTVAGLLGAIALIEAVAIAAMMPLKSVEPVMVMVDRQTGFAQTVDPNAPRKLSADDALTQSLLAQYVIAREGFDRSSVALDHRRVGLWSAGAARSAYLALMPASNPASPLNLYRNASVSVDVKSVSRINADTALVRFDTTQHDANGLAQPPRPWISLVRFTFADAPMRFEDRLVNPLGFQVTSYRRDAEGAGASPLPAAPVGVPQ